MPGTSHGFESENFVIFLMLLFCVSVWPTMGVGCVCFFGVGFEEEEIRGLILGGNADSMGALVDSLWLVSCYFVQKTS